MLKFKRLLVGLVTIALIATMVACTNTSSGNGATTAVTTAATASTTEEEKTGYDKLLKINLLCGTELIDENILAPKLKEFGIELNSVKAVTDAGTEVPLMFASGNYAEWMDISHYDTFPALAYDGYFLNILDYMDKLPNFRAVFTDEEWEKDVAARKYDDGKLYYMSQYRAWKAYMGWLYREDLLTANGLSMPKDIYEIRDLCKKWKEIYPDSIPIADKWDFCFTGIRYAFGSYPYVNQKTGKFQAYYQAENEYRDALVFFYDLYKNGYIDPEFATASNAQFEEKFANANPCIIYGATTWEDSLDKYAKVSTDPLNKNPNWKAIEAIISSDPNYKCFELVVSAQPWGNFITDKIKDQEGLLDRLLAFLDWTCTEEGQRWQNFGIEGLTYYVEDGVPKYNLNKVDPFGARKDGTPNKNVWGMLSYTVWNGDAITANYGNNAWERYGNAAMSDPNGVGIRPNLAINVPKDKISEKAELETLLNTVKDEYTLKFKTCMLNPGSDDDWNMYISELKAVGLEKYQALMTELYNAQYKK